MFRFHSTQLLDGKVASVRNPSRSLTHITCLSIFALPILFSPSNVWAESSVDKDNRHIFANDLFPIDVIPNLMHNYRVNGEIPLIKQSKKMGCWATTGAMMAGWMKHRLISVDEYVAGLGSKFQKLYNSDSGIQRSQMLSYMSVSGLEFEWGACYTTRGLQNLLQKFGPLCFTIVDSSGLSDHATLVIGLIGTGEMNSTYIIYIDPLDGNEHKVLYPKFMNDYENVAARMNEDGILVEGYQLIHYPKSK